MKEKDEKMNRTNVERKKILFFYFEGRMHDRMRKINHVQREKKMKQGDSHNIEMMEWFQLLEQEKLRYERKEVRLSEEKGHNMKELCVREIHYVKMSVVTCMPFLLMRKGGSTLQSPR